MNRTTISFFIGICLILHAHAAHSQISSVTYLPSDEMFLNPERGFTITHSTGMEPGRITPYEPLSTRWLQEARQGHSLVFRYFGLKAWRNVDLPDSVLKSINQDFAAVRAAGMKIIPRFCYAAEIGEPDAPLNVILRHLDQLKPLLYENKDVIAFMQAGFIGAWGEWHSSTNGNESLRAMQLVLNKVLEVLPADRMVLLRAPSYKQELFSLPFDASAAVTSLQAFSGASVARVGHHNDCFLSGDDDAGTYRRNGRIDTAMAKAYLSLDTRYVPIGGETCRLSPFSGCPNALKEMARLRWTFLSDGHRASVIDGFVSGGCLDEMGKRLGYRFSMLKSEFNSSVRLNGKFTIRITLVNSGWASLYNPRHVELRLRRKSDGTMYVVRLPVDPRMWQAGDTVHVNVTAGIPRTMRGGEYAVLLNLPDPDPSLSARPEYAIRFANRNVWEPATGYNNLLDSVMISTSESTDTYKGNLWFQSVAAAK